MKGRPIEASDPFVQVAIALGSNLGNRKEHLDYAVDVLHLDLSDISVSTFCETQPAGVGAEHGPYLNGALVGRTQLGPRDLLDRLLEIEGDRGRSRPYLNAPRTLDLDLILYGEMVVNEDGLTLPHPRFRERSFVLVSLNEIAPELVDPVTRHTIGELNALLR